MADPIYGLNRTGIARTAETNRRVLGRLPDSGRRTRRVYPPGGGGGCTTIRFTITSLDPLKGSVDAICCDGTVDDEYNGQVTLVDALGCLTLELDLKGYATRMKPTGGECQWEITALCCP